MIRITIMTKTAAGTFEESGDIGMEIFDAEPPVTVEETVDCLSDLGYRPGCGFAGWGIVLRHEETGELLSVSEAS